MERIDKINYYLDIAQTVAKRCTCIRKMYGAIIVKHDTIISTGYNGAPRGRKNCNDMNFCLREYLKIPQGEEYEKCRSVHAEANAIIIASREQMMGATLYMVGLEPKTGEVLQNTDSCSMCKRLIINAGISTVIIRKPNNEFRTVSVSSWVEEDDSLPESFGFFDTMV